MKMWSVKDHFPMCLVESFSSVEAKLHIALSYQFPLRIVNLQIIRFECDVIYL